MTAISILTSLKIGTKSTNQTMVQNSLGHKTEQLEYFCTSKTGKTKTPFLQQLIQRRSYAVNIKDWEPGKNWKNSWWEFAVVQLWERTFAPGWLQQNHCRSLRMMNPPPQFPVLSFPLSSFLTGSYFVVQATLTLGAILLLNPLTYRPPYVIHHVRFLCIPKDVKQRKLVWKNWVIHCLSKPGKVFPKLPPPFL